MKFKGVYTALITPFKSGEVDFKSLEKLVKYQIDGGVSGLVINGTTGESPTLSDGEVKEIFKNVRSLVGDQVCLILGAGTNSTKSTLSKIKLAEELGANGLLLVTPYYNKPSQRGLFQHFTKAAESTDLPIILYNVPGRSVAKLELSTLQELSKIPNIVAIKEASGDIEFGRQIVDTCGNNLVLLSGDDPTWADLMGVGGQGVISVISHIIPKQMMDAYQALSKTDKTARAHAFKEFSKYQELNKTLYVEANPIPLKMVLKWMGLIESSELRLPLTELDEKFWEPMRHALEEAEVKLP